MEQTYRSLKTPISLSSEFKVGFAFLYAILDILFMFYRESPPFQGQQELTYTAFGLLAVIGLLASIGAYSSIWKVSKPMRLLALILFIYSSICVLTNSLWFVAVFFCLPCG